MKKISYNLFGFVLVLLMLTSFAGCKQMADRSEEDSAMESSGDHMNAESAKENPENMSEMFKGTVVEMIDASRYTYVQIDTGEKMVWVAAPAFDCTVGETVSVPPGMPMANFQSKTLDREFEMIYFVGAIHREGENQAASPQQEMPKDLPPIGGQPEMPKDHPPLAGQAGEQMTHPPMGTMPEASAIEIGTIEKEEGGQTVSEIITGRESLAGKQVRVRAKVVKFTPDIMDKNWLHVRDGSGVEGTNDLIVTTDAAVNVGDVVLVSGIVSVDRDLGFGLVYRVLIENAEVAVEKDNK